MKRNKYVRIITVALLLIIVLYTNFNIIKDYDIEYREDKAIVKVDFKQPMKKIIEDKIEVTTDLENVIYAVDWEGKILQIHVPNPKGVSNQNINVKIKGAKSKIPLIKKKLDITFRSKIDYVIDIYKLQPKINEVGVELYPKILIETTYPIKEIYINGLEGNFTIDDNKAELKLLEILKPNTEYKAKIALIPYEGVKSNIVNMKFKTKEVKEPYIEILTEDFNILNVYRDGQIVKTYIASVGEVGMETPKGIYYTEAKGESFFSKRYGQGAKYWTKIVDDYLVHGLPRDINGDIILSEVDKLGSPASHGCVRLEDENAKWIYDNLQQNTMVIIR